MESEKRLYYEQTSNDARYNREIPVAFESLYKYCQRLVDYLLKVFPEGLAACGGKSFFIHHFDISIKIILSYVHLRIMNDLITLRSMNIPNLINAGSFLFILRAVITAFSRIF
jgi:hypothetical protein